MWLFSWLRALWRSVARAFAPPRRIEALGTVMCAKPPSMEETKTGLIYVVHANGKDRWAVFRCPCGCDDLVTLSLQDVHNPHWRLSGQASTPSLYPSVWRTEGCRSHFWVKGGRVQWV